MNIQTLKGFRDFLPKEARKRQYVIDTLKKVFESYGFEPLETPVLEYDEILSGKYGEEGEKLMYRFVDNGDRRVAMRYDQTVPLARVVAQYQNELPFPFKRYQIQNVWRADNTQRGRYREFLQCDIDSIGTTSSLSDAEIIAVVDRSLKELGFKNYEIGINDRRLLFKKLTEEGIPEHLFNEVIKVIDKVDKIGWPQLNKELEQLGIPSDKVTSLNSALSVTQYIEQDVYLANTLTACKNLGITNVRPKLYLARGLDYYTGLIIEVVVPEYGLDKSVGGGGRYDKLIGMFAGRDIPAVGFAFGFDRILEAMDTLNLFPGSIINSSSKVLVTIFYPELEQKSLEISSRLRSNNINTELYLEPSAKMEKQLKYADQKGIPYAIIIGPDEAEKGIVTLKNLKERTQEQLPLEDLIKKLQQ